jgi:hypothetical protein
VADRVQVYVAPLTLGPVGVRWLDAAELPLAGLHDVSVEQFGPDVRIQAYVHRAH